MGKELIGIPDRLTYTHTLFVLPFIETAYSGIIRFIVHIILCRCRNYSICIIVPDSGKHRILATPLIIGVITGKRCLNRILPQAIQLIFLSRSIRQCRCQTYRIRLSGFILIMIITVSEIAWSKPILLINLITLGCRQYQIIIPVVMCHPYMPAP